MKESAISKETDVNPSHWEFCLLMLASSRRPTLELVLKAGEKDKPVSDQWLDPFVIVDENDKAVGPVEVRLKPFLS